MRRGSPHFPYPLIVALFALCPVLSPTAKAQAASAPAAAAVLVMNGLGKGDALLEGKWQFQLGDGLAWASPQVDDTSWEQLTAEKPWGAQGHGSAAGFAWYRDHISITPAGETSAFAGCFGRAQSGRRTRRLCPLQTLFATHASAAEATDAAVDFGQHDDFTVLTLTRLAMGEQSTVVHRVPRLVFVQA